MTLRQAQCGDAQSNAHRKSHKNYPIIFLTFIRHLQEFLWGRQDAIPIKKAIACSPFLYPAWGKENKYVLSSDRFCQSI
ncbi:MAG: hypothetical protein KME17_10670 [Cyanosarcina radialis HA8281-LM2]|nr:hypothetical protein [Cyanosarcina radialis HA8281-LM2]